MQGEYVSTRFANGPLLMERSSELFHINVQVPARIQTALVPLLEAIDYAEQTRSDSWEFAVELDMLIALGLTPNDFRWLVRNGLVEHKREVTVESDDGRAFRPTGDLTFPTGTCFVLTNKGVLLSRQSIGVAKLNGNGNRNSVSFESDVHLDLNSRYSPAHKNGHHLAQAMRPCWDSERRVLLFNGTTVKHFKWAAENQEAILCVFEEEGWPYRIDDPLKPSPEQDSKRRLSDTIKCLNRKQCHALIRFRGDGTGEGVIWEVAECHGASCNAHT